MPGTLVKTIKTDEDKKQVIDFTDKEGKTILRKVQVLPNIIDDGTTGSGHLDWLCTYYLYDDLGNLRCTIQPAGVKSIQPSWSLIDATLLAEQCFRYEYDDRNRITLKKVAGSGEVWMVYDKWDRLVLTQDANLRVQNKWLFTKYDNQNRPIVTGFYTYTAASQKIMQDFLNSQTSLLRFETYTTTTFPLYSLNQSFPIVTSADVLTCTYYDNYGWAASYSTYASKDDSFDSQFSNASNSVYPYPQSVASSALTRGLITGQWKNSDGGLITALFYDEKGRVIQAKSRNFTGGIDISTTQYDWSGKVLRTYVKHEKAGTNAQVHNILSKIDYDDMARVLTIKKQVNTGTEKTVVSNIYDALGQLKTKTLGSALETLNFDYNIRGWLLGTNRDFLSVPSSESNWFGFEVAYL